MPTTYAIPNGSTAFAATLYTGNATTNSINIANNGVGFQPDFSWFKVRSETGNHIVHDVLRGAGGVNRLFPNTTSAESTNGDGFVTFTSTGFDLNGGGSGGDVNAMTGGVGRTYVAWSWKANGAAVTNTAGSITSQVSANTAAGFSVVTYTGTGSLATVGHGLGVAPSMVIIKSRSQAANWTVYHSSVGNTGALFLNLTNATDTGSAYWNNTSPTSSVFTINTGSASNTSGQTYVAYCWAAVPGYSAFGSYTGNGSSDGPFVFTNMRPRFILIKRTDTAGFDWILQDTSRSTYNSADSVLNPNSSAAEQNGGGYNLDVLSNGFKLRNSGGQTNASGGTYIYMAFAENPFKNSLAR